ncbi:hypothetical protein GGR20_003723 [Devosia subaequoris]|uniref:Uncharacterized protein n=1 Tax=Devosia subaequoris TaxID=395930 RepID=A0A7W6IRU4_9HYPH|nr:hypothetical protein [Devosia subaequoris]MBB4054051.1 hypothetical protein [Devosia subaequoris]MCP1211596.1 hypothetical protein [Devosia subaequoris]
MMAAACCSPIGLLMGLFSMATPLVAIGAILYLVFAKPKADPTTKVT